MLDGQAERTAPVGTVRVSAPGVEEWDLLTGTDCAWAANRAGDRRRQGVVSAQGPAALTLALERLGYEVMDRPEPDVPLFQADREGFRLRVEQDGTWLRLEGEDALAAAAAFAAQGGAAPLESVRPEAVPAFGTEGDGLEQM